MNRHSVCITQSIRGCSRIKASLLHWLLSPLFILIIVPAFCFFGAPHPLWCVNVRGRGIFRQPTPHCQSNECAPQHLYTSSWSSRKELLRPGFFFSYHIWIDGWTTSPDPVSRPFITLLSHLLIFTSLIQIASLLLLTLLDFPCLRSDP